VYVAISSASVAQASLAFLSTFSGNGDWEREDARALGVFLNGDEIPSHDRDGNPIEPRHQLAVVADSASHLTPARIG
jgi:hypothetical protein